jgi:hypothetical protein
MKRFILLLLTLAAALAASGQASGFAFPCGLPATSPLWIEFSDGSVEWRQGVFGKPGVIVATNGVERAAEMRSLGAQTVYWHMNLKGLTGTPTAPRDPADTEQRANALYDRAAASAGCAQPIVALNELNGARAPTPWSATTAQYRANVALVMKTLAQRGAVPFLLVPGPARGRNVPNVSADTVAWWQEIASHGFIVRQLYFNAQYIYNRGPVVGSRLRRIAMRQGLSALTAIGIPADRIGLMLGFQSGAGKGGREGLQPGLAWFEVIKREALAARHVASELGISTIWSWGWGTFLHFAPQGADPDKPAAACVYLWTRDPSLCDGPTAAGTGFNTSLTEGQLSLPADVQCVIGSDTILAEDVKAIEAGIGDRALALRAALQRLLFQQAGATVDEADVKSAEAAAVGLSFGGDQNAYLAALAAATLTRPLAKRALEDLLARQQARALAAISAPSRDFPGWLNSTQRQAIKTAVCAGDEVPTAGTFEWTSYMPFVLPDPSLSLRVSPRVVRKGQRVTLSGKVSSSHASEVVTVYALDPELGAYEPVGEASVATDGTWQLSLAPRHKGQTVYRAASRSAASKAIAIRVRGGKPSADG